MYYFQELEEITDDDDTVSCASTSAELATESVPADVVVKLEEMFDWDEGNGVDGNSY